MPTVGIGLLTLTPQVDANRGHDLTFLLTLIITPQGDADRGHDLTFLLTLTITPRPMPTVVMILRSFLHLRVRRNVRS
jgi:hypothetical protein